MFSLHTVVIALLALAIGVVAMIVNKSWTVSAKRLWPYVWILTGVIAILYAAWAIWRHQQFETHAFDLAIFDQAVWHLSRFQSPASTVREIANLFGDHFHPILILLAPWYWLWRTPVILLIAQAILLAGTLPVAYALGLRLKISPLPALIIALTIAVNPGMVMAILFDFHEAAFSPIVFLGAALAAVNQRWKWYWVLGIALCLTKESLCVYAAFLGLTVALRGLLSGWRSLAVRHGLGLFVAGLALFFLITRIIMPSLNQGQAYGYWRQYSAVGATPFQLAKNLVVHPRKTLSVLRDNPDKRLTTRYVLAPAAYIPLISWSTWPLTLLTFGERFWTDSRGIWLYQFQYQLMMVVVFGLGVLYTIHDVERWPRLRGIGAAVAVAMVIGTGWTYSKVRPWDSLTTIATEQRPIKQWQSALKNIPPAGAVSAQDAFVPHLAERQKIYHFPNIQDAEWIILDPRAPSWPLTADDVRRAQTSLRQDPEWEVVYSVGETTVLRKR